MTVSCTCKDGGIGGVRAAMRQAFLVIAWFAALIAGGPGMQRDAQAAAAGDWPQRPVRLVVPFAPGGGVDIVARIMGSALSEQFGQQFVVDNRPGAAGIVGVEIVAKALPDGYTILVGTAATTNPTGIVTTPNFDPTKELTGVTLLASIPNVLVSGMAFPAGTLNELIEYTKARPGQLNYSNPIGAFSHIDMLELSARAGLQAVNIPSKGAGSTVAAVISGEIHYSFLAAAAVMQHVKAARMKAYVTTARRRLPELPDVPTLAEAGYPGVGSELLIGFFAPPKMTPALIDKLHTAAVQATQRPQVRELFAKANVPMTVSRSPAEFQEFINNAIKRWARILKENNIKMY